MSSSKIINKMNKSELPMNIENFIPDSLPIEKSFHQQLTDVKETIIKMFIGRGFINPENKEKYIEKLIEDDNDDLEYVMQLDNEKNYNTEIKNKKVYIKIFDYKISSINKNSPIGEFLSKYDKEYKLLIVQNINARTELTIESYGTQVEIFEFNKLQSDITENVRVPQHIVLTKEETDEFFISYRAKKRDMPLIRSNEAVARYYNMKPDNVVKIIRPSPTTSESIAYRLVVKSKDTKAKT